MKQGGGRRQQVETERDETRPAERGHVAGHDQDDVVAVAAPTARRVPISESEAILVAFPVADRDGEDQSAGTTEAPLKEPGGWHLEGTWRRNAVALESGTGRRGPPCGAGGSG